MTTAMINRPQARSRLKPHALRTPLAGLFPQEVGFVNKRLGTVIELGIRVPLPKWTLGAVQGLQPGSRLPGLLK